MIESNHKMVNQIVLQMLMVDSLTSSGLTVLNAIAGQCPMAGGDAVYEARAMVSHFTGQEFDDSQLCGANRPSRGRESEQNRGVEKSLSVFPNPTTGILMWSGIEGSVLVKVFNHLGQLQVEKEVSDSQIALSQLPDGMYIVQFCSKSGELLSNSKVTLLKH